VVQELIEKTRMRQAAVMSEVTWRGRTVPVKSEHARLLLLNIHGYEQQLANTDTVDGQLSIYEKMAKDLVDVQQLLKDEYKDDPVRVSGIFTLNHCLQVAFHTRVRFYLIDGASTLCCCYFCIYRISRLVCEQLQVVTRECQMECICTLTCRICVSLKLRNVILL
jgi:hypothetical protein